MNHYAVEIIAHDHQASMMAQAAEHRRARKAQRPAGWSPLRDRVAGLIDIRGRFARRAVTAVTPR